MKKVITLVLALVLTVSAAIGGTVAYLTSEDSDVNVMTVGNVKIEQHQYQRKDGVAHTATLNEGDLIEAKQGQKLYPAYPLTDDAYEAEGSNLLYWGPYVTGAGAGNGLWNDEKLIGTMDKFVFVENTGKSDAYYRTVIAYECPEGIVYDLEDNAQADIIVNQNGNARFSYSVIGRTTIDGSQYLLVEYLYKEVLKAGEISRPSLLQLVMKGHVTNDQVELFGDTYDVLVYTQACQTENFPSASIALDAAFGDITATTHPWSENAPKIPVVVDNKNEFVEAIKDGDDIVLACDVDLADEVLTIAKNKDVVIHFNGNTISGRSTSNSASSLFDIQTGATLTLKGDGLVSFYATTPDTNWGEGQPKPFPGYANNTVKLTGKLVVDGVTLVNETGKGGASYVIDCYPGADLVVNSGTIKQTGGDTAIRMFANSATVATNVTINGGTISGRRAVWVQLPSSNAAVAPIVNLTINGGNLTTSDAEYAQVIYSYSYGNSQANTNIALNGGTYYGNVAFGGGTKVVPENVVIDKNNCTFYGDVFSYNTAAEDFNVEAEGTLVKANTSASALTTIINNAAEGETIAFAGDVNVSTTQLAINKNVTLDLGENTLTTSNNYGGMTLTNGASIVNGTINHTGNTAAIKVSGTAGNIENVTINMTPTAGKTKTGIQVYNGKYVKEIKNVTITGTTQGIEVAKGSRVDLIENVTVKAVADGSKKGVALLVNAASVGKAVNCTFEGNYGVYMMLNGEFHVALELDNCVVTGSAAALIAHDEAGISNTTNCSLTLTYDAATKLNGEFVWNFEDECLGVVTLNRPN